MSASEALRTDQAAGLRGLAQPRPVRVICVASGKGGVGKTSTTINLAVALASLRRRVLILDADLGLANVDVLLGLLHKKLLLAAVHDRLEAASKRRAPRSGPRE